MATISTYVTTWNALFWQSTLEQTVRQSLLFSDEVVICNSSNSTDGTQNLLDELKSEYPNIIRLYPYKEPEIINQDTLADRRTFALKKCSGDYCILMDDDEMIHENCANYVKMIPRMCPEAIAFRFNIVHFYRSFDRYQIGGNWYPRKIYMIKNRKGIKHGRIGTDPDNHILSSGEPVDSLSIPLIDNTSVTVYHYGWANRNDAILLMKKYFQEIQWWGKDYWKSHEFPFHEFPFKFDDPNRLPRFNGSHPKYMIPIIEQEKKFNSKRIKEFDKMN